MIRSLLRPFGQRDQEPMPHTMHGPTEHEADETLKDDGGKGLHGHDRSRPDHEHHRCCIDGTSDNIFVGTGSNELTTMSRQHIGARA